MDVSKWGIIPGIWKCINAKDNWKPQQQNEVKVNDSAFLHIPCKMLNLCTQTIAFNFVLIFKNDGSGSNNNSQTLKKYEVFYFGTKSL